MKLDAALRVTVLLRLNMLKRFLSIDQITLPTMKLITVDNETKVPSRNIRTERVTYLL